MAEVTEVACRVAEGLMVCQACRHLRALHFLTGQVQPDGHETRTGGCYASTKTGELVLQGDGQTPCPCGKGP